MRDFGRPLVHFGDAALGFACAVLPATNFCHGNGAAFTRLRQPLVMRRQVGLAANEQLAERLILGRQLVDQFAMVVTRRKGGARLLGFIPFGLRGRDVLLCGGDAFLQSAAGLLKPVQGIFGLIGRAQGVAKVGVGLLLLSGSRAVLFLSLGNLRGDPFGGFGLLLKCGFGDRNLLFQFVQPVLAYQLLCRSRAVIVSGKSVPAAQLAVFGNQPLAGHQRSAVICVDDADHRQARVQFLRGLDMVDQPCSRNGRQFGAAPQPATARCATDHRVDILAQCRGEGAFIAGCGFDAVKRTVAARLA